MRKLELINKYIRIFKVKLSRSQLTVHIFAIAYVRVHAATPSIVVRMTYFSFKFRFAKLHYIYIYVQYLYTCSIIYTKRKRNEFMKKN